MAVNQGNGEKRRPPAKTPWTTLPTRTGGEHGTASGRDFGDTLLGGRPTGESWRRFDGRNIDRLCGARPQPLGA